MTQPYHSYIIRVKVLGLGHPTKFTQNPLCSFDVQIVIGVQVMIIILLCRQIVPTMGLELWSWWAAKAGSLPCMHLLQAVRWMSAWYPRYHHLNTHYSLSYEHCGNLHFQPHTIHLSGDCPQFSHPLHGPLYNQAWVKSSSQLAKFWEFDTWSWQAFI